MMLTRIATRSLATLALLAIPGLTSAADDPQHGSPLISHEKLQEQLNDSKIRLLDARPRADYDEGHIPGAVWVDTKALQELSESGTIKDEAAWAKALAPLGISDENQVIFVYDSARQHDAARVWWSLAYAGVPRVGLVDGGFTLWQKENRPVSTELAKLSPGDFRPHLHAKRLASRDDVRKGGAQLLDSRSSAEYSGESKPKDSKTAAGHIPGARNLDSYALVDADGHFLNKDTLHKKLGEAGIAADRPVIAYSQGGNRSSITVFALERIGIPVRHYVSGLAEWSSEAHAPIASGREPGK